MNSPSGSSSRRDDDPATILGVSPEAGEAEIRAAYLRKVREHPPDRSPREFERIRDAYGLLRDPHRRVERMLHADPDAPFVSLLDETVPSPKHVGPRAWLESMRRG